MFNVKSLLWHGGSIYDAWFSCASNQVAQVLLTLPYSFSQLGMLSGILFQIFYGLVGNWTAYVISVLYIEYRSRKEKVNVSFKNHVIHVTFQNNISKKAKKRKSGVAENSYFAFLINSTRAYLLTTVCHFSGSKCLTDYWVLTGKLWDWPSTVHFSSLGPLYC
uniref:Amino acid transporter transmembrane domain-containing protein n=1 Tax=Nelumbo nucifera TaxID=4432 RepID=A0A822XFS4_NELNU|nr:TPA_asm: hypothetical protein HUJ06_019424 [Nelumbo nucifera]